MRPDLGRHVMIDMETLSTRSNPVVRSIAAVAFDLHQPWSHAGDAVQYAPLFEADVRLAGQQEAGLHVDLETVKWWMGQSDAARARFTRKEDIRVDSVLVPLLGAFRTVGTDVPWHDGGARVWSYGACSDLVWLRSLCEAYGYEFPIHYRNLWCARTFAGVMEVGVADDYRKPDEPKHDPYWDCIAQIRMLRHARTKQIMSTRMDV
jgi:hypothetical protein